MFDPFASSRLTPLLTPPFTQKNDCSSPLQQSFPPTIHPRSLREMAVAAPYVYSLGYDHNLIAFTQQPDELALRKHFGHSQPKRYHVALPVPPQKTIHPVFSSSLLAIVTESYLASNNTVFLPPPCTNNDIIELNVKRESSPVKKTTKKRKSSERKRNSEGEEENYVIPPYKRPSPSLSLSISSHSPSLPSSFLTPPSQSSPPLQPKAPIVQTTVPEAVPFRSMRPSMMSHSQSSLLSPPSSFHSPLQSTSSIQSISPIFNSTVQRTPSVFPSSSLFYSTPTHSTDERRNDPLVRQVRLAPPRPSSGDFISSSSSFPTRVLTPPIRSQSVRPHLQPSHLPPLGSVQIERSFPSTVKTLQMNPSGRMYATLRYN